jgi:hypothetical protein
VSGGNETLRSEVKAIVEAPFCRAKRDERPVGFTSTANASGKKSTRNRQLNFLALFDLVKVIKSSSVKAARITHAIFTRGNERGCKNRRIVPEDITK